MIIIRQIGVLSLAKIFGIVAGGLGLIGGLLASGLGLLGAILGGVVYGDSYLSTASLGSMLAFVFVLPIIYAILAFIGGIITAFLINLALRFGGGLELAADVREKPVSPAAAPGLRPLPARSPVQAPRNGKGKKKDRINRTTEKNVLR